MASLAGPCIAMRQDQRRLPFRGDMAAFDMLVHFAETGHGHQVRLMHFLQDLAGVGARRPDIGDATTRDDDFLIRQPHPRMHVEQFANPQPYVGGDMAQGHAHQPLADLHLIGGADQIVPGQGRLCHVGCSCGAGSAMDAL